MKGAKCATCGRARIQGAACMCNMRTPVERMRDSRDWLEQCAAGAGGNGVRRLAALKVRKLNEAIIEGGEQG